MFRKFAVAIVLPLVLSACCNKWQDDADELVENQARCAAGDTCVRVNYSESVGPNNCLGAFQCSQALNEKGLSSFLSEAREIAEDFESCNSCTMADCIPADPNVSQAVCNTEIGRCEIVTSEP